jgi:hypothetical protein
VLLLLTETRVNDISTEKQMNAQVVNGELVTIWKEAFVVLFKTHRPPLWSSDQSFWLQIQRSRVRFPALPDFLRSSGSGTGSTRHREDN